MSVFRSLGRTSTAVTVFVTEARVAVTSPVTVEATSAVPIEKVAEVCPCGTVTLAGIVSAEFVVARVTSDPPEGAGAFKVTVPVAVSPL
ncbi:MAG: hypothetical protein DIJKHBIC_04798 [Thermoanaerobaculia bacterium]|nr:hypothetical protein [Thermoanaerobaculia bacterium]